MGISSFHKSSYQDMPCSFIPQNQIYTEEFTLWGYQDIEVFLDFPVYNTLN